jgi:predicted RNA-binding Zn ribbon-like protein
VTASVQNDLKRLPEPLMIADHPVLDFLNTVAMIDGERVDFFENDGNVVAWLRQAGYAIAPDMKLRPGKLLETARSVRQILRDAVEHRKMSKSLELSELNRLLEKSSSHLVLSQGRRKELQMSRIWQSGTAEQFLGPLVEAAAELLVTGDFELVRACEDQTCILWFYDRTKSHHRRWCSMSTCGNRFKVAAFRERRRASAL